LTQLESSAAREWATIALLMGILLLPALQFVAGGWRGDTVDERRTPAPFPELRDTAHFAKRFETFFDDRFGFRRSLIRLSNAINVELFRTSPVKRVMVGKDGWLYLNVRSQGRDAADLIRHYHGVQRLTPSQLASWKRAIERQRDQAERRGARYLFLVAPDKRTIYPEHLSDHLGFRTPTALDQLWAALAETSVAHVDLRPSLWSAKPLGNVYWRTGSHWNDLGAKVVDDEIVRGLAPWFAELAPRPLEAHRVTWSDGDGRGIASMLHLQDRYGESHPELEPLLPAAAVQLDSAAVIHSLAKQAALRESYERAPWTVFVTGNAALPRAVIVMDSFGAALMPYLSEHFERSVFLTRTIPPAQRLALIELERPDVVIEEIVERNVRGSGGVLAGFGLGRAATGSDQQIPPGDHPRLRADPHVFRPELAR
jgi:hypothetical protein